MSEQLTPERLAELRQMAENSDLVYAGVALSLLDEIDRLRKLLMKLGHIKSADAFDWAVLGEIDEAEMKAERAEAEVQRLRAALEEAATALEKCETPSRLWGRRYAVVRRIDAALNAPGTAQNARTATGATE